MGDRCVGGMMRFGWCLITTTMWCACSTPHSLKEQSPPLIFRHPPPIADADPNRKSPQVFRLPTGIVVQHTDSCNLFIIDRATTEDITLDVGYKMVTGMSANIYVWSNGMRKGTISMQAGCCFVGQEIYRINCPADTIQPASVDSVEAELTLFETDIPSQHMWEPFSSRYKVLWTRTIRFSKN
jgi:hypothetical protein